MIIWDDILQQHDIRIKGAVKAQLNKYLGGSSIPNSNVTVEQAELVVTNFLNGAVVDEGYHVYIHIFSFPKKTQEEVPFVYTIWLGGIGDEPVVYPGNTYWWER